MKRVITLMLTFALFCSMTVMTGCAKSSKAASPAPVATVAVADVSALSDTVYFDFDKADLRDETKILLNKKAQILKQTGLCVTIEGAADVRGSVVYNSTLGLKRAVAVRDYLISQGVNEDQVNYISLGEYVQLPRKEGESKEDWYQKNRRGEFHIFVK